MAACTQGYQCEFVDPVPIELSCKKCKLVARRLTLTKCCEESYCNAYLVDSQKQGKPCPACGVEEFTTFQFKRYLKRVQDLKVYCSMKERGCDWSGTLEQLDTHLDPDQDNCQYVDTKCPLNCHMTIPKNKVEQHVAQHCAKRPYVCQHCNFEATYEEVVDTHLPECKYVPLQCPNRCGVTFERDFMEDHMKICRLEEVGCEFSGVGCDGRSRREDQEEHTRQNSQKHLTLTASLAVETKQQLQQKLLEQDKKHKKEEEKLRQKIEEQERKIKELQDKVDTWELTVENRLSSFALKHVFEMRNFSKEKGNAKVDEWKSPAMYTHMYGYKFSVGVDANGRGQGRGKAIAIGPWSMPGEYDDLLKWPARVVFTIELINQKGRENAIYKSGEVKWSRPAQPYEPTVVFRRISVGGNAAFLEHSEVSDFLVNDTLLFRISNIHLKF